MALLQPIVEIAMRKSISAAILFAAFFAQIIFPIASVDAEARHAEGRFAPMARTPERERPPSAYARPEPPRAAQTRPQKLDRSYYNHNFSADHGYHIGPYHAPKGYHYRRWVYGDVLPPTFWAQDYWLTDYWLFGLDVPPMGYEWVRYGPDALLIDLATGEIVQVVYGRFL